MNNKILVMYASQGGSTAGVAKAIGQTLASRGLTVEVKPVKEVNVLNGYGAVVLGSAIHSGKWMPEMLAFVEGNRNNLRRIPTAAFQVCLMLATGSETYRRMPPEWFAPLHAHIRPLAEESFTGALWPDRYPKWTDKLGLRIFLAVVKVKAGDYRDWDAIRSWADCIGPMLCR